MKYIIEIENEPFGRNDDPVIPHGMDKLYRAKGFKSLVFDKNGLDKLIPYTEPDRECIENEVWEFVRCVHKMNGDDYHECFDIADVSDEDYCTKYSYQEAKAKYEAWLKQKDEIFNTGDEVWDYKMKSRGVVLRIYNSGNIDILWDDGSAGECIYHKKIHKTGRHFPEVAELLEKMRGES